MRINKNMLLCMAFLGLGLSAFSDPQFISVPQDLLGYNEPASGTISAVFIYKGVLYLGTPDGLSISYDRGETFKNYGVLNGLSGWFISKVLVNDRGIYVKSTDGHYLSEDGGATFTMQASKPKGFKNDVRFRTIHENDNELKKVIALKVTYRKKWKRFDVDSLNLPHPEIRSVHREEDLICIGTYNGFSISEDKGKTFRTRKINKFPLNEGHIHGFTLIGDKIFVASLFGISVVTLDEGFLQNRLNGEQLKTDNFSIETTLKKQWVQQIHNIGDDVFLATHGNGLVISHDGGKNFLMEQSSIKKLVSRTSKLKKLVLGDLKVVEEARFETPPYMQQYPGNYWPHELRFIAGDDTFIFVSSESTIWSSRDKGRSFQLTSFENERGHAINGLFYGHGFLAVTTRNGFYYSKDQGATFTCRTADDGLGEWSRKRSTDTNVAFTTGEGRVYVGTEDGLYVSDDEGESYSRISLLENDAKKTDEITAIHEAEGILYVAVSSELFVSNDKGETWKVFGRKAGLGAGTIEGIMAINDKVFLMTEYNLRVNTEPLLP